MRWSWRQAAVALVAAAAAAAAAADAHPLGRRSASEIPPRRRLLSKLFCTNCLAAQPSDPPQPSDDFTSTAVQLAMLAFPQAVNRSSSGGADRPAWEADATALALQLGAVAAPRFLNGNATGTDGLVVLGGDKLVVSFRGLEGGRGSPESATVLDVGLEPLDSFGLPGDSNLSSSAANASVHAGFLRAAEEVYPQMVEAISALYPTGQLPIYFVGTSLGGALATLSAWLLAATEQAPIGGVWTFGSPRVGDAGWAQAYAAAGLESRTLRFASGLDPVPLLPPPSADGYTHVGRLVYIPRDQGSCLEATASQASPCANETCGAFDYCAAAAEKNGSDWQQICSDAGEEFANICDGGNPLYETLLEGALGSGTLGALCDLAGAAFADPPSCCMVATAGKGMLASAAGDAAAALLPAWLKAAFAYSDTPGGPSPPSFDYLWSYHVGYLTSVPAACINKT